MIYYPVKIVCAHCGKESIKEKRHVNRAKKQGAKLYCDRTCAGLGRRNNKTIAQKKEEKRLYDIEYRRKNEPRLKKVRAAYFKRDYAANPEKYRARRKARQSLHNEYCRTPEYRAWKKEYDKKYRAKKDYGELWEASLILTTLEANLSSREDIQEIRFQKGSLNKSIKRKRKYYGANSAKLEKLPVGNLGGLKK